MLVAKDALTRSPKCTVRIWFCMVALINQFNNWYRHRFDKTFEKWDLNVCENGFASKNMNLSSLILWPTNKFYHFFDLFVDFRNFSSSRDDKNCRLEFALKTLFASLVFCTPKTLQKKIGTVFRYPSKWTKVKETLIGPIFQNFEHANRNAGLLTCHQSKDVINKLWCRKYNQTLSWAISQKQ